MYICILQINANKINLRKFKNEADMKDGHKNDNPYPPYFKVLVHHYKPSCLLDVQFKISISTTVNTFFNLYLKPDKPDTPGSYIRSYMS